MNGARMREESSSCKNKIQVQNVSMPKGGGTIKGIGETFQPNAFSGVGSYSVPIPLTPARGFEPKLTLDYNSGGGSDVFGMGFSLSIPKISRKTDTGIPRYTPKDIFILTNEGELTPKLVKQNEQWVLDEKTVSENGITWSVRTYLPRQQGSFSLIEQWCDPVTEESWWKVVSSDNVTFRYGVSGGSRIADPNNAARIFEWLIEESFDCKGNRILYHYKPENGKNISRQVYETNRALHAKKYIQRVQYGNYFLDATSVTEQFTFEVVFDYGEYDLSDLDKPGCTPYVPVREWAERKDPFSSYRSSFEIRTFRLCRNILIFHSFKELGSSPALVKALHLTHNETPSFAFLKSITQTGYRINQDGSYASQSLPPLELEYSRFDPPVTPEFKPLTVDGNNAPPGYLNKADFQPVDLKGEGLPGLLLSNTDTTLYFEPLGDGTYQPPLALSSFPITRNFQNPTLSLQSLDGNGQLELVLSTPSIAGYYSQEHDGSWAAFRNFQSIPTDLTSRHAESSDLDGNGKADLLVFNNPNLVFYPSEGKVGYGAPRVVPMQEGFPAAADYGQTELVTFADIFGDGLSHRVRVRNGSVEAWPNLGYGYFGKKVILGNAPNFDMTTTAARIFLADVDGSGTADLVLAYASRVEIYLNHAGNSFADEPVSIPLPGELSDLNRLHFSDILGEGTSALVFTKAGPEMSHWYYNFCGERTEVIQGKTVRKSALKPYLLTKTDNNLGAVTDIYYASSTQCYLEDKKAGRPWATRLPFPVHVVEKTVTTDEISGSRLIRTYKYHDGYFDPVEREFRGFGFVESWDTECFEDYKRSVSNPAFPSDRLNKELYVPPIHTKTWHHTGAYYENKSITRQYKKEYFQGDKDAYSFPDSVFDPEVFQNGPETIRQAYAALKGTVMRQEVYALDNRLEQDIPYTVSESNVTVRLVQPKGDQLYAVFLVSPRESITYRYERNPEDPRIQQEFTLEVDLLCGKTKKSCTVYLPRRTGNSPIYPEQQEPTATARYDQYINTSDATPYRYRGVPYQSQEFEVLGLDLKGKSYCSFADVIPITAALDNPLPYQAAPTPGQLQAQQLTWNRSLFWNDDQSATLPLGELSCHALLHHSEQAVFTREFVSQTFGPQLTDDTIQSSGGYVFDAASGYWWNKGLTQYYLRPPGTFCLPCQTENTSTAPSSPLFTKATVEYDQPYYLSAVKTTQYIDETNPDQDKRANTETTQIDYVTLQPYQLTDINGNVSQALFDPLGQVIVTTLFGTQNSSLVGGMTLCPYDGKSVEYAPQSNASLDAILAPGGAEKYLQGATSYFYYNLWAWKEQKQPPYAISLVRDTFYHTAQGISAFDYKTTISYSDGFARELEAKIETDGKWIVSGRTVYNNKGKPCEQYLPYFSDVPAFEPQQEIVDQKLVPPPTVIRYDPLLRPIRTDTPKGFFSRVEFTPWEEKHYDQDDTVMDSAYFTEFIKHYPKPPEKPTQAQVDELDALNKAAKFYNTPSISILDTGGNPIRVIQNNLGNVTPDDFKNIVEGTAITPDSLFNELVTQGYLQTNADSPIGTWVTEKFQPYIAGFVLQLGRPYKQFIQQVTKLLKQNCLTSFNEYDIQGRLTVSIDPRLYYANQTAGTNYDTLKYRYAMGEEKPVHTDSADAGPQRHLANIFGKLLWSLSPRNYCQLIAYDRLQRRSSVSVKKLLDDKPVISYADFNLVEVFEYGETQPPTPNNNLRGRLFRVKDLSGIVTHSQYDLQGELLQTSRQMAANYKTPIDWNPSAPVPELEPEIHTSRFVYNALTLLMTETTPDGSVTTNTYNRAGQLNQVKIAFSDRSEQQAIKLIDYDAKGQRTTIQYGNDITTNYAYDPCTLNLTRLWSVRPGTPIETVQDITYTYDPVGNITRSRNRTAETVFNNNQQIDPLSGYTYDALYQLTSASGRQHPGINANTYKNNSKDGDFKQCIFSQLPNVNDADKLENYSETYAYDDSGNLTAKQHSAASASWKKLTEVEANSNRLLGLAYDESGNLRQLEINNTVKLSFNCCENLVSAGIIQRPDELDDCDYYVYDYNEQRTRKVGERMASSGTITLVEDKIYLGNYEIKRDLRINAQGDKTVAMERQTLRIMDGSTCVLVVQYCSIGKEAGTRKLRFQLGNNLGSISSEYDPTAQLISYEEYFPYGDTAIIAGFNQAEVRLKDYRYSGKECDDSTGLYYYGRRYYAPWLSRWLNPDPAGMVDGMNLFSFVKNNPIRHKDTTGLSIGDYPPFSWIAKAREHIKDKAYDLAKEHGPPIARQAAEKLKGQVGDVVTRIPEETFSRFNPGYVYAALMNPDAIQQSFHQRIQPAINFYQFARSPSQYMSQNWARIFLPYQRAMYHIHSLEGFKLAHGMRATGDYAKDKVAEYSGAFLLTSLYFLYPTNRAKTAAMRNRLFNWNVFLRQLNTVPLRFFFASPVAKIAAHPIAVFSLIGYTFLGGVGKNLEARAQLEHQHPKLLQELKTAKKDFISSDRHLSIGKSIKKTSSSQ